MTKQGAIALRDKVLSVIISCETMGQLQIAIHYANLAYRKLSIHAGLVSYTNFSTLADRSIGFMHYKILNVKELEK